MAMLLIDGTLSFEAIHDEMRMQDPAILALRRERGAGVSRESTPAEGCCARPEPNV